MSKHPPSCYDKRNRTQTDRRLSNLFPRCSLCIFLIVIDPWRACLLGIGTGYHHEERLLTKLFKFVFETSQSTYILQLTYELSEYGLSKYFYQQPRNLNTTYTREPSTIP